MKMHLLSSLQMREALLKSARRESSGPSSVHTLDLLSSKTSPPLCLGWGASLPSAGPSLQPFPSVSPGQGLSHLTLPPNGRRRHGN